ncbi:MAG: hypothetical protein AAF721_00090 [Myxococcota bacterium]
MEWSSVAVGAVVATLVVVGVYERGRLVDGEATAASPERTQGDAVASGGAECVSRARDAGPSDAAREASAQLAEARRRIAELERQSVKGSPAATAEPETAAARAKSIFVASEERLLREAEHCRIRVVLTPLEAHGAPPAIFESDQAKRWKSVGLSDAEAKAIDDFFRGTNEDMATLVRELYIEATGDEAGAATLSADGMVTEILARSDDATTRRQVARERAGLATPGADPSQDPPALRLHRARYAAMAGLYDTLGDFGDDRRDEVLAHMPIYQIGFGGCEPED